jgi:tetratricopeptide (TPR) repeat protein
MALAAVALAAMLGYASNRREQTYRGLIEQGNDALAKGESFAAIEAFTVAIALKPESMLGYLKRGEAYKQYARQETTLLETALKDLRTASQLDPTATRPLELLGDVEHSLRRYDRAARRYEQYVRIDDRSPRVLYKLALAKYHAGAPADAVQSLTSALRMDPKLAEAHYLLGLCLDTLRRRDRARASLHRAVELSPALLDAREKLADLDRQAGRTDERIYQLEALRTLDPGAAARHVAVGLAYAEARQFDRAVTVLGRATERFPGHAYTYVALGRVWLDSVEGRSDPIALRKAIEALERGAAEDASSEALALLGRALLLGGQADRAFTVLTDATAKRPLYPAAFLHLADAAERLQQPAVARDALLDYHALEGDPDDNRRRAELFGRIADLSVRAGDPPVAVDWLRRAAAADPDSVDAAFFVRLADAYLRAGDTAAAREALATALQQDPAHRGARALLRRLTLTPDR